MAGPGVQGVAECASRTGGCGLSPLEFSVGGLRDPRSILWSLRPSQPAASLGFIPQPWWLRLLPSFTFSLPHPLDGFLGARRASGSALWSRGRGRDRRASSPLLWRSSGLRSCGTEAEREMTQLIRALPGRALQRPPFLTKGTPRSRCSREGSVVPISCHQLVSGLLLDAVLWDPRYSQCP